MICKWRICSNGCLISKTWDLMNLGQIVGFAVEGHKVVVYSPLEIFV